MSDRSDFSLQYVETWDGLYAPIGLRLPPGAGPFPAVLLSHGNGGGGAAWIREAMQHRRYTVDRFVEAGYACAWTRYRTEVDSGYARGGRLRRAPGPGNEVLSRSPLEYEDAIAIVEHVRALDAVDGDRVAWVGVSHGGEMLLKMAAEYDGLAAGVAAEPAAHEYLGLGPDDVRRIKQAAVERGLSSPTEADVRRVHEVIASDVLAPRLAGVSTPMLVMGRESDDLQALFRATYEVLRDAGKDVAWTSYEHDVHGYVFPVTDGRGAEDAEDVDDVARAAVDDVIGYLTRRLGPPGPAAAAGREG
jgi:dienelactone hydrolase